MKGSRRLSADDASKRLLELWQRKEEYGAPVGCIATTFTFDEAFFELDCLGRFVGVETLPSEDQVGYMVEREERFSGITACVLVDRHHAAEKRSLRWFQLAVGPGSSGLMHAKVTILVWERRIRLLVGSANLTKAGYRQNFENVASFDFTPEGETPLLMLRDALEFLLDRVGVGTTDVRSAAEKVRLLIDTIRRQIGTDRRRKGCWAEGESKPGSVSVHFVPLVPGGQSLFVRLGELWRGTGAEQATVVSPFWDEGEQAKDVADALVNVMGRNGTRTLVFHSSGDELPDGTVNIALPEAYRKSWADRRAHEFRITPSVDENGDGRQLHSKLVRLEKGDEVMLVVGSSNFTMAGTGCRRGHRGTNIEANVVYVIPPAQRSFAKQCSMAFPPFRDVEESKDVRFEGSKSTDEAGLSDACPLPVKFGEALFEPVGDHGRLLLEIGPGYPGNYRLQTLDGRTIEPVVIERAPGWFASEWGAEDPPSVLVVRWVTDGIDLSAYWPVNVTDPSRLAPPAELRDLSLDELTEILAGDLPLQEALRRARRRASKREAEGTTNLEEKLARELDPHRRVDTSGFLLRRIRRLSNAMEGLLVRLQRPAFTMDSLRWRLLGPVGPRALSRQIVEHEPSIAPFLLAELALTIKAVDWAETDRYVLRADREREVAHILEELRSMVRTDGLDASLCQYVNDSFEEVMA